MIEYGESHCSEMKQLELEVPDFPDFLKKPSLSPDVS